jgi:prepilin-type N-terminal cleavage/methylation domain-containing protein
MKTQRGFTLIETLIAIFILTLTVSSLIGLAANGYYSVRYSQNQIVADNLLQESLEYLHNSRDTAAQQGTSWSDWVNSLSVSDTGAIVGGSNQGCYASSGCIVDPYSNTTQVRACDGTCEGIVKYSSGFYGYNDSSYPLSAGINTPVPSGFVRTITAQLNTPDQLTITSTVTWMDGYNPRSESQSILLTNWKNS